MWHSLLWHDLGYTIYVDVAHSCAPLADVQVHTNLRASAPLYRLQLHMLVVVCCGCIGQLVSHSYIIMASWCYFSSLHQTCHM